MEALGPWHLLLILIGFMVLFGYKKLPEATRSLGRSLRIFKSEMRGMAEDGPSTGAPVHSTSPGTTPPLPSSAEALEAQAVAAEAHAAQLRARVAAESPPPNRST
jgi:sec-independent protein translocase protein TatA